MSSIKLLVGLYAGLCFFALPVSGAQITIGLQSQGRSASITGSNMVAHDAAGVSYTLGNSLRATLSSGKKVTLNGKTMTSPVVVTSNGNWKFKKTAYSGEIVFVAAQGLTVAERLDIEEYVRGVLKMEVSPSWPMEALKAQAIISRTYAYRNLGRFAPLGFDLDDSVMSQVYRGVNAHDSRCDQAVMATRGQVLTYEGQPAQTFFHADSGGATTAVDNVWNDYLPYLAGAPDPYPTNSRAARWQLKLTASQVGNAVAKLGKSVGSVRRIVIASRDPFGRPITLRFEGTWGSVTVKSSQFRNAVGPEKLKSTFFGINEEPLFIAYQVGKPEAKPLVKVDQQGQWVNDDEQALLDVLNAAGMTEEENVKEKGQPLPEADFINDDNSKSGVTANALETQDASVDDAQFQSMIESGAFNSTQLMELLLHPENKAAIVRQALAGNTTANKSKPKKLVKPEGQQYPAFTGPERAATVDGGGFTFIGRGTGHGVGLSQWECKVMADNGWTAEEILAHFYPGTRLETR